MSEALYQAVDMHRELVLHYVRNGSSITDALTNANLAAEAHKTYVLHVQRELEGPRLTSRSAIQQYADETLRTAASPTIASGYGEARSDGYAARSTEPSY